METLKVFTAVFFLAGAYLIASYEDYHNTVDNSRTVRYNCDMLIGSWHPDVPLKVIEECRKLRNNAKTY